MNSYTAIPIDFLFVRQQEPQLQQCEETVSVALNCTNRYIASQLSTRSIDLDSASISLWGFIC